MAFKIETEMVALEELFGIESNDKSGAPIKFPRFKEPNPYTPDVSNMKYVLRKEHLKAMLLGLADGLRFNVRFVGDKGCGKSDGLAYVLGVLNWGLISIDCHEAMEMPDLSGFWVNRKEGMHRIDGPLVQFIRQQEYPVAFCFEEMDSLPASTLIGCNQFVQSRRFTLYDGENGLEVLKDLNRKPLFSTGNTVGGSDDRHVYPGLQRQNMASLSRWIVQKVDYLTVDEETKHVVSQTGLGEKYARLLTDIANATRIAYQSNSADSIGNPMSTREVIDAAKLWMVYENPEDALRMAYYNKLEHRNDRQTVQEIVQRFIGDCDLEGSNVAKAA